MNKNINKKGAQSTPVSPQFKPQNPDNDKSPPPNGTVLTNASQSLKTAPFSKTQPRQRKRGKGKAGKGRRRV